MGAAAGIPVGALWGLLLFLLPGEPGAGLVIGGSYGLMVVVLLVLLPLIPVGSWSVPLLVLAAPIGSLACRWVAGRTPDRPDVVRR